MTMNHPRSEQGSAAQIAKIFPLVLAICAVGFLGAKFDRGSAVLSFRRLDAEEPTGNTIIPHQIWFIHENDILETDDDDDHAKNMLNTVDKYRQAWVDPIAPVHFLGTDECKELIEQAEPKLVPYFESEDHGHRKGDLCRAAALYVHGGFFFSEELQVARSLIPPTGISFVSALACDGKCFHQGFVASIPEHPIIKKSLEQLLKHYKKSKVNPVALIRYPLSVTMLNAYEELSELEKGNVYLLEELELDFRIENGYENIKYPTVTRQAGTGKCNLVLHDPNAEELYFFEHFLGSKQCSRGLIPRILWFTNDYNLLVTKEPKTTYDNVMNSIAKYRKFWSEPDAPVNFMDNTYCREIIDEVIPALLPYFDTEIYGGYKGDMCRNAAISREGGYYMDIDMEVIVPVHPEEKTTFIAPRSCGSIETGLCLLNAFFACTPNHPIILSSLQKMLQLYSGNEDSFMLGPFTMWQAWQELPGDPDNNKEIELLHETQLDFGDFPEVYPDFPRQPLESHHCNWIVHHPKKKIVHFYSRFFGYGACAET